MQWLSWPPGHTLANVQLLLTSFFHWATFQPLCPKPVALNGIVVIQVQDLAVNLVGPHTIGLSLKTVI